MFRTVTIAAGLSLLLAQATPAATLLTPPLEPSPTSADFLICNATNVTTRDRIIRIEILDVDGAVVIDSGDLAAAPFRRLSAFAVAADTPSMCRFTVAGAKRSVRASACVFDGGITDQGCRASVAAE